MRSSPRRGPRRLGVEPLSPWAAGRSARWLAAPPRPLRRPSASHPHAPTQRNTFSYRLSNAVWLFNVTSRVWTEVRVPRSRPAQPSPAIPRSDHREKVLPNDCSDATRAPCRMGHAASVRGDTLVVRVRRRLTGGPAWSDAITQVWGGILYREDGSYTSANDLWCALRCAAPRTGGCSSIAHPRAERTLDLVTLHWTALQRSICDPTSGVPCAFWGSFTQIDDTLVRARE
jgi:hypothetical protein